MRAFRYTDFVGDGAPDIDLEDERHLDRIYDMAATLPFPASSCDFLQSELIGAGRVIRELIVKIRKAAREGL